MGKTVKQRTDLDPSVSRTFLRACSLGCKNGWCTNDAGAIDARLIGARTIDARMIGARMIGLVRWQLLFVVR